MIKNIIWDWNGTIVDDAPVFVSIMNELLREYNLKTISIEDYKKCFCFPIEKYWKSLGFNLSYPEFVKINMRFIDLYRKKMFLSKLQAGCVDVIRSFDEKNFYQAILSASEKNILNHSVGFYKINSYFSSLWGVDNFNALGKQFLGKKMLESLKINPNETVLIGDTLYDYQVAQFCGFFCVLVSYGHFNKSRLTFKGGPFIADSPKKIITGINLL